MESRSINVNLDVGSNELRLVEISNEAVMKFQTWFIIGQFSHEIGCTSS